MVNSFRLIEVFGTDFHAMKRFIDSASSSEISTSALALSWIMSNGTKKEI